MCHNMVENGMRFTEETPVKSRDKKCARAEE